MTNPEPVADDRARVIADVLTRFAGDLTRGILDRQDYGYYEGRDWAKGFLRDTVAAAVAALSDTAAPDHDPTSPEPLDQVLAWAARRDVPTTFRTPAADGKAEILADLREEVARIRAAADV